MKTQLIGRSSSGFTRVARIFAHEVDVPIELVPVYDMAAMEPSVFGGNPALKIPSLRRDGGLLFGTENICRALADASTASKRVIWPEQLHNDVSRNVQEFIWHSMAAQVQLIMGTGVGKLPADNVYFTKARTGFEGALRYVDAHLDQALEALPAERDVSLLEVTLFCLWEHLFFRVTIPTSPYAAIAAFARRFAARPSALATPYGFDPSPAPSAIPQRTG
jgi:glutathione S-transferase